MKMSHIFWGVLLISLGVLVLLNNVGELYFDWDLILEYWPLALVLLGVSLLFKENIIRGILTGVIAIFMALIIFAAADYVFDLADDGIVIDDDEIVVSGDYSVSNFSEPTDSTIKNGILKFDADAGSFYINGKTDSLFDARVVSLKDAYSLLRSNDDESATVVFKMTKHRFSLGKGKLRNKVSMKLNEDVNWDMDFDVGAAKIDFDLSPFMVNRLYLDAGAASVKIRLGDRSKESRVKIDAGASSIKIHVPESAGCEIRTSTSLSHKSFDEFREINSHLYRTNNFDTSEKKIYLSIETGVSSIKVERYGGRW